MVHAIIDRFDGTTYAFLSNFYPAPIKYEGIIYPTSEAAFQAAKTFDNNKRKEIAAATDPAMAKRIGRHIELRPDWEEIKYDIMKAIVKNKFTQNPTIAQRLLETKDAYLVEGNTWHDNCWGNCQCSNCKNKKGTNWLGYILMEVRQELKEQL